MNKAKINQLVKKYVNQNNIQFIVIFIPLLLIVVNQINNGEFLFSDFLDTTILFSFILAIISEILAKIITGFVLEKCEDASKLREDYEDLAKKYCREPIIEYTNLIDSEPKKVKFPVICLFFRKKDDEGYNIVLDNNHSQEKYVLPQQIAERSDWLMNAHEKSVLYNNMNVRLNDVRKEDNNIILTCSQTTYFDSMITNRAMDYSWENGKSIREIYEPGPFVSRLSESKLSNHLGFNGFVETSDHKIIFVERGKNLSIGKGTLGDSIGASLKVKYCYNTDRELTQEGLFNAIVEEIKDELKIVVSPTENAVRNSIFAFYRDLVEGGKPQFLFYYKLQDMTEAQFRENFRSVIKESNLKEEKKKAIIDGTEFYCYTLEELKQAQIFPGEMITSDGKHHKMMPSASASIILLLRYMEQ